MEKRSVEVTFKVLQILDKRNWGSILKKSGVYRGTLTADGKVWWRDPGSSQEWVFYVGDTCELIEPEPDG